MERDPRAVHLYPASTAGARHEIVLPPVAPKKARVGLRLSMLKRTYFCGQGRWKQAKSGKVEVWAMNP